MVKICFVESYKKVPDKSKVIDAHFRNSLLLVEYLQCDFIMEDADFANCFKNKYDVLIFAYVTRYSPFKNIQKLHDLNLQAKIIVLSNEYNMSSVSILSKTDFYLISNYIREKSKYMLENYFLNLNLLLANAPNVLKAKKYDCIYYGTFRENRIKYFKEYLHSPLYLSTSSKNMKKYDSIKCNALFLQKFKWGKKNETLNLFKYSLYIEDEHTHTNYNCLANRWYEAGVCNNVVFFDINCKNTILKSEIAPYINEIEFYFVNSYSELIFKINECNNDFNKHLNVQLNWREDVLVLKEEMLKSFKNIINKVANLT